MTMTAKYLDETIRLLDPRSREEEASRGDMGCSVAHVRAIDDDTRTITAVVSTGGVDRYEEIVEPKAFEQRLGSFQANPVFVAGHCYSSANGEPTVIGSWSDIRITDDSLIATATFADTPLGERYWQLYKQKHMRAFSVGWITHAWEMRELAVDGAKRKLRVFTDVELVEISAVAIPANREALALAASFRTRAGEAIAGEVLTSNNDDLIAAVTDAVITTIKQQLSPEPGGLLHQLMTDTAELTQCHAAPGATPNDSVDATAGTDADAAQRIEKLLKAALNKD